MILRVGRPPERSRSYRVRPGAYAILPRDGQILLTAQLTDIVDIQLPGGGIDPGESAVPALHREILEETGWRIARPRRLGAFREFTYMPEYDLWAEKVCHVYVARPSREVAPIMEEDHEAFWMSPWDAAEALGSDGSRHFLRQILQGDSTAARCL